FDWSKIKAPAFIVHGTNDRNVRTKQSDLMFQTYKKAGVTAKLLWHQGVHTTPSGFQIGEYHYREIMNKWWSRYLYDVPNGIENYPTVTWENSVDGAWYTFDSWEAADTEIFKKDDAVTVPFTTINSYYSSHSPAISSSNFRNYFMRADTPHSTVISKKLTESYIIKGAMEIKIRAAVDNLIISPEEYIEPEPDYPEPGRFSIYLDEEYQLDWDAINEGLESGDIEQGDVMGLMRDYPPASLLEELQPTPEAEALTAISRGDNLIISAMLIEISDTPFLNYTGSGTRTVVSGGIWYGDGMSNGNITEFTQVAATQNTLTGKYYKEFAYGWMDLANPSAKYNSASAHRKDRVDLEPGKFYDYTLYLMPTMHTVRAGNELALVIFCQFPGQYGGPSNAQGHYTITIDNAVTGGNLFRDPVNTVQFLDTDETTVLATQYIPDNNLIKLATVPVIADTITHTFAGWTVKGETAKFDLTTAIDKDYDLVPLMVERPDLATIVVQDVVTSPGGTVNVTYSITNNVNGFTTLELDLPYDRTICWPTVITPGAILNNGGTGAFAANPSYGGADLAKVTFASFDKVLGDGLLFTVTYQVAAGTLAVETVLDVDLIRATLLTAGAYNNIHIKVKPGTMVIGKLGDINGDGLVTPEDAMLLLQMIVGLIPWTERALRFGDINGDGIVDTSDAALILRMVVGG
ncbi:MAG: dockerin type I domain-containing protein, partial [Clostridiales bacterium]|nr:dockerin type I domain-containing protein [Clostridiales bacterium]